MVKIDENQEAIAAIRMAVDNYDKAMQDEAPEDDEIPEPSELVQFNVAQRLWAFGAPERTTTAKALEQGVFAQHPDSLFHHLDTRLKAFLREHVSIDCISDDTALKVWNVFTLKFHY